METKDWHHNWKKSRKKIVPILVLIVIFFVNTEKCLATSIFESMGEVQPHSLNAIEMAKISIEAQKKLQKENDIVTLVKERKEEERKIELGRQKARARERQEARELALAEEKAKKEAEEKAQKERYLYLLPELDLFERILQAEASQKDGNPGDLIATGQVILNRVVTTYEDFRNVHTITEVFYQMEPREQYHPDTKKKVEGRLEEPTPLAKEVAFGLLTGEYPSIDKRVLFQSSEKKDWMDGHVEQVIIPEAVQFYAIPLDYEEKCLPEG